MYLVVRKGRSRSYYYHGQQDQRTAKGPKRQPRFYLRLYSRKLAAADELVFTLVVMVFRSKREWRRRL